MRGHHTAGMQPPVMYHTLYRSVHLSLIHIYISHTHSVTLTAYLKKTRYHQSANKTNYDITLSLPSEDMRKKDILHIVKSTIIAA